MKRLFTVLMVVLSFSVSKAQMADGSIAPDWTLTDINGVSHNLYSYLDQGYVVYLDFSATWCPPCWSYHNSNAFKDVYNNYGPGTADDKVMVFMIEGDASTTSNDLVGTGSNTLGDWTAGVPYPIIDDASITSLYQIGYWPTIYKVCPSRVISEIGQANAAALWAAAQEPDCQAATHSVDAMIQGYSGETAICGIIGAQMSVDIMNFGTNPLTAADINVVDASGNTIQTVSWTGNLASYGTETVSLGGLNLTQTEDITFEVVAAGDANAANNTFVHQIAVAAEVSNTTIDIQIQTDNYGYETYWAILDDAGNIAVQADGSLAQGGNSAVGLNGGGAQVATHTGPGAYGNNQLINEQVTLPATPEYMCYQFVIVDDYGDGICCSYGNGFYNVFDMAGASPLLFTGGEFAESTSNAFYKVLNVNTEEVTALNGIKVFPNPATTNVNIQFNLDNTSDMAINITNALGQTVKHVNTGNMNAGQHNFAVSTSDLAAGMYFINFTDGVNVITERFVVAK